MLATNKTIRMIASLLALALVLAISASPSFAANKNVVYKNCTALKKTYKNGVGLSGKSTNKGGALAAQPQIAPDVYRKNSKLDLDRDGLICETESESSTSNSNSSASTNEANQLVRASLASIAKPLSACQLKETANLTGAGPKGFPARQEIPATGTVKIAIVPVDFANAIGTGNPSQMFSDDIKNMKSWAQYYSRGKLNYEIEFHGDSWVRSPKGADWYTCVECHKGAKEQKQPMDIAAQELITAANKTYEFNKTQIIYFVFPSVAEEKFGTSVYSHPAKFDTRAGAISAAVYGEMGGGTGARPDRSKIWDHAIHEILHFQGFIGHGPENGSPFYITTDQWGSSKSVTSWEAFLNGWFSENEILCVDAKDISSKMQIRMSSLDDFGDHIESLMVRLSDSELIVVERRKSGSFTQKCPNCRIAFFEGFSAYRINVNAAMYRDDSDPNGESKNFWSYLRESGKAKLNKGVSYSGFDIRPLSGDVIELAPNSK